MSDPIQTAIIAHMKQVKGIGQVFAYEPYHRQMQDLVSLYLVSGKINGWSVLRESVIETPATIGTIGVFQKPGTGAHRARVSALLTTEEFAFQKLLGDRAAINSDERPIAARRESMDRASRKFLAATGGTMNVNRRHEGGDARQEVQRLPHGGAGQIKIAQHFVSGHIDPISLVSIF